ncbi:MAG: hypothetical protein AAF236_00930 [Verrucomicrobiota bacterium]
MEPASTDSATPREQDFSGKDFDQLRTLLNSSERTAIENLEREVAIHQRPTFLGERLPEALDSSHRGARDALAESLQGPLIDAIAASASDRRAELSEALFPVLGRAIRLHVTEVFQSLTERLNQVIQQATSLRQFQWRLQALFSGTPYSEYLLLKTLDYRVERVLCVAPDSGLLLQQVAADDQTDENADLISSMLVAIRSFVKDSFAAGADDEENDGGDLGRFTYGNREIFLEVGPQAILAAVVYGTPPQDYRSSMKQCLEEIHGTHRGRLESFDGDPESLDSLREHLSDLLISQALQGEADSSNKSPLLLAVGTFLLIAVALTGFSFWKNHRWNQAIALLGEEPGFVVLEHDHSTWDRDSLSILRDPLAATVESMKADSALKPISKADWTNFAYLSGEPVFTKRRDEARRVALKSALPDMVDQRVGLQMTDWFERSPDVTAWRRQIEVRTRRAETTALRLIQANLNKRLGDEIASRLELSVSDDGWILGGSLPPESLRILQSETAAIFGTKTVDFSKVSVMEVSALAELASVIESIPLLYQAESTELSSRGRLNLERLNRHLWHYTNLAREAGQGLPQLVLSATRGSDRETALTYSHLTKLRMNALIKHFEDTGLSAVWPVFVSHEENSKSGPHGIFLFVNHPDQP